MATIDINTAATAVAAGELIAYPTEAVYGLGCDAHNEAAVQRLIELKARAANKGMILIAASWPQLESFVDVQDKARLQQAMQTWPGPVTWVVPANAGVSPALTGGRGTVAVRVSAHPVVIELCNACNCALVSTSANISGDSPLASADEIATVFGDNIKGIVAGSLGTLDKPTAIYDLSSGNRLR